MDSADPTNKILNWQDWNRRELPLILPTYFVTRYNKELREWQINALRAGSIVLVQGFWCVLSTYLYATSGDRTNKQLPYYLKFKNKRHAKVR